MGTVRLLVRAAVAASSRRAYREAADSHPHVLTARSMNDAPASRPSAPPRPPAPDRPAESMRRLEPARIMETIRALIVRIDERFPDRGLARVARQQLAAAEETLRTLAWVQRPILWVRVAVASVILLLLALLTGIAVRMEFSAEGIPLPDLLQTVEAAINELIFLGAAILFLTTVEGRIKRGRALVALRELRALAHIVDMHQLTKDPDRVLGGQALRTPSSPAATMTRAELARYLDYCSELLALDSKLAALYAQTLHDPVVLAAVDEVETLTTGLSAKIWQKLVILNERSADAG